VKRSTRFGQLSGSTRLLCIDLAQKDTGQLISRDDCLGILEESEVTGLPLACGKVAPFLARLTAILEGPASQVRISEGRACRVRSATLDHPSWFGGHDKHAPPTFPSEKPAFQVRCPTLDDPSHFRGHTVKKRVVQDVMIDPSRLYLSQTLLPEA